MSTLLATAHVHREPEWTFKCLSYPGQVTLKQEAGGTDTQCVSFLLSRLLVLNNIVLGCKTISPENVLALNLTHEGFWTEGSQCPEL